MHIQTITASVVVLVLSGVTGGSIEPEAILDQQRVGEAVLDSGTLAAVEAALPKLRSDMDKVGLLRILGRLAAGYGDLGDYEKAIRYATEQLEVSRQSQLRFYEAAALNNLGMLATYRGEYDVARERIDGALEILMSLPSGDSRVVIERAKTLNNLGMLYHHVGRTSAAKQAFEDALQVYQVSGRDDLVLTQLKGITLANLAEVLNAAGRFEEAHDRASQAAEFARVSNDRIGESLALNNSGVAKNQSGAYAEAVELLKRALAIRIDIKDRGGIPITINNLGFAYARLGRLDEAEQSYQTALKFLETALRPDDAAVTSTRINLASALDAQGKRVEAGLVFDRAVNLLKTRLRYHSRFLSEREQLSFLEKSAYAFDIYFSFCLRHYKSDPTLIEQMYDVLLWRKGFVVLSEAARRARIDTTDPGRVAVFEQVAAKRASLSGLERRAHGVAATGQSAAQITALESEILDLERKLYQDAAARVDDENEVSWRDVQRGLARDDAAVEFAHFRYHDGKRFDRTDRYVALIVTPGAVRPNVVELGSTATLGPKLEDYQTFVRASDPGAVNKATADGVAAAIWTPLTRALQGAKRLYLSPDGELHKVSWSALSAGPSQRVIDTHDVRVVLSTKDLLGRPTATAFPGTATLVGNPRFDLGQGATSQSPPSLSGRRPPVQIESVRGGCPVKWGGLDQTAVEVGRIGSLLKAKGWSVTSLLGADALEETVKRTSHPRVLHLATHGCFRESSPVETAGDGDGAIPLDEPMLQSFLVFAGANHATGDAIPIGRDDGILTAYEASALRLQGTELVVLSACETGLGRVKNGEGVFGLGRALQVAGAEAVLMSLWSVPDDMTQLLMTRFYEHWLSGADKHTALRRAQTEVRDEVKAKFGVDLPFYWAAFVLVGS